MTVMAEYLEASIPVLERLLVCRQRARCDAPVAEYIGF